MFLYQRSYSVYKGENMKRIIVLTVALAVAIAIGACNSTGSNSGTNSNANLRGTNTNTGYMAPAANNSSPLEPVVAPNSANMNVNTRVLPANGNAPNKNSKPSTNAVLTTNANSKKKP
jgi:hypothetical protein